MNARGSTQALYACLLLVSAARPCAGQVVTENGGVISPQTPILRESLTYLHTEDAKELRWNIQLIISAPGFPLEAKVTLPVVYRHVDAFGVGPREGLFGLGDLSLRLKQSLWQSDDVMASTRLAALGEVTFPTGKDHEEDRGVRLPPRLQLGTGAFAYGGGLVFTLIRDRHRFSAEAFFRHTARHDGVRPGQTLDLNLAYWFRIEPAQFSPDEEEQVEVRGVIEVLTTYRLPSHVGDRRANDDGFVAWVAPGIQVYPLTWLLLEASVQAPVYQDVDDELGRRKFAATFAIKYLF